MPDKVPLGQKLYPKLGRKASNGQPSSATTPSVLFILCCSLRLQGKLLISSKSHSIILPVKKLFINVRTILGIFEFLPKDNLETGLIGN